ncbi:imidazole glycerol phosphate synthase subunit HisF [Sphingomonas koreensis]|uniref:Imidazole glycerol phosphate synthase subunit HisF n=1 Tax=Sphingomonas koreensis TaxID=93064 RepID=A0A2M8WFV8_9SPHN|nr:AglZ/HisF2 family acetamidino modification protein [Sphingomonas koreensis]PJI89805.1 cyclase [Sphingomonas koreensis]RSU61918.1 imidazole glycerol phosphate synthase subunit HisF [Sphingomonas koreensis]RSU70572.1 imidazole glycerol phosphate synthase subunit HisF [Sphingomonas koreensis]RSY81959.1 imidazole glycerol phosphate synthase subunit HisF [Sphingomonas koreensis]
MLRPRIIPCLLIKDGGLVKTVKFGDAKYVGDPINAVRIFNEKQVDELIVANIDATVHGREPDYAVIANLAAECRMPLCYSGGVRTAEQVDRIISLGVEKVGISSGAIERPEMISEAARRVGAQSIVAVMDVKRTGLLKGYELVTHNGTRRTGLKPADWARKAQELGAGEILVNSVDRDGGMQGYDLDLAQQVRSAVGVPITVLGGAGSLADIEAVLRRFGVIGVSAGSLFVFKGKYRAVLINYPGGAEKDALFANAMRAT